MAETARKTRKKATEPQGKTEETKLTVIEGGVKITAAFTKKANAADRHIVELYATISNSYVKLATACMEIRDKAYWKAILHSVEVDAEGKELAADAPRTGVFADLPFVRFGDYVQDRLGKSASTAFESMRVIRELTTPGPGQVEEKDIDEMPKENAGTLTKIAPEKRTREVIEAAKHLPAKQFQTEIAAPLIGTSQSLHDGKTGEVQTPKPEIVRRIGPFNVVEPVSIKWERAMEVARWAVGRLDDSQDVFKSLSSDEKAFYAIATEFLAGHEAEYEDMLAQQREKDEATLRQQNAGEEDLREGAQAAVDENEEGPGRGPEAA